MSKIDISQIKSADDLITLLQKEYSFHFTIPVDVEKIAKLLNIDIEEYVGFDEIDVVGKIELQKNGKAKIKINLLQNDYEPRRRFTIAHEIGHYCKHLSNNKRQFIDTQRSMSRSSSYWDLIESEANSFAAQLLMPKDLIISEGQKIIDEYKKLHLADGIPIQEFIERMARKFNVSFPAMEYRLKNMGII
jgi:Zn-dependent peptidase ImmA (M78 family)